MHFTQFSKLVAFVVVAAVTSNAAPAVFTRAFDVGTICTDPNLTGTCSGLPVSGIPSACTTLAAPFVNSITSIRVDPGFDCQFFQNSPSCGPGSISVKNGDTAPDLIGTGFNDNIGSYICFGCARPFSFAALRLPPQCFLCVFSTSASQGSNCVAFIFDIVLTRPATLMGRGTVRDYTRHSDGPRSFGRQRAPGRARTLPEPQEGGGGRDERAHHNKFLGQPLAYLGDVDEKDEALWEFIGGAEEEGKKRRGPAGDAVVISSSTSIDTDTAQNKMHAHAHTHSARTSSSSLPPFAILLPLTLPRPAQTEGVLLALRKRALMAEYFGVGGRDVYAL
ncbi:hypothetical protein DFH09DRAFT_1340712 [Mycena vulgaris]|nr:hypothetical protein DFH09DRAFT_1340712 [Mycena vulgaris]